MNDRPPLLPVIVAGAAFYVAWLFHGTRSNPPVPYDQFPSGYTWGGVRQLLKQEQDDAYEAGQYMFVGRSTVLGRWRQLKLEQYERYLDDYEEGDEDLPF